MFKKFTTKDSAPAALGAAGRNASMPYLMGCCCIFFLLFIIAAVIILALIPTYLPDKGDGLSRVNTTSKTSTLTGSATSTSGRKRASYDISNFLGADMGQSGKNMFRTKLTALVPKNIGEVLVSRVTIAIDAGSSGKKRSALERSARAADTYVYVVEFLIMYAESCLESCQEAADTVLQQIFYNAPLENLVFNNIPMYRDGQSIGTLPFLRTYRILHVSSIIPRGDSRQPGRGRATRLMTSTSSSSVTSMLPG